MTTTLRCQVIGREPSIDGRENIDYVVLARTMIDGVYYSLADRAVMLEDGGAVAVLREEVILTLSIYSSEGDRISYSSRSVGATETRKAFNEEEEEEEEEDWWRY